MILSNAEHIELESSEGVEKKAFSFDEQSIGLMINAFLRYANPIGALIRELVSNAYDANKEANSSEPIIVSLDYSDRDYNFIVKDTGIGMSKEVLEQIYIKFGASTKRNSDDYIGAYGLGSKSPLGYAEYFICETVKDGLKNTVVITKTGNIPDANFLDESFCDEPNGTKITVPVKRADYYKFIAEIKSQLRYFDNVVFLGDTNIESDIIKTEHFITNVKFTGQNSRLHICMGKVYYPIRADLIFTPEFESIPKSRQLKKLIESNIGLYFNIGEIDVIWNREDISYTKENIDKIIQKLVTVFDKVSDVVTSIISKVREEHLLYCLIVDENDLFNETNLQESNLQKILSMVKDPLSYYKKNEELVKIGRNVLENFATRTYYYKTTRKKVVSYEVDFNIFSHSDYIYYGTRKRQDFESFVRRTGYSLSTFVIKHDSFESYLESNRHKTELINIYNEHNLAELSETGSETVSLDDEEIINLYSKLYSSVIDKLILIYLNKIHENYPKKLQTIVDTEKDSIQIEKRIRVVDVSADHKKGTVVEYETISRFVTQKYDVSEGKKKSLVVLATFDLVDILYHTYNVYKILYGARLDLRFFALSENSIKRLNRENLGKKVELINLEEAVTQLERPLISYKFFLDNEQEISETIINYTNATFSYVTNGKELKREVLFFRPMFKKYREHDTLRNSLSYLLKLVTLDKDYIYKHKVLDIVKQCRVLESYYHMFTSYVNSNFNLNWVRHTVWTELSTQLHNKHKEKNGFYKVFKNS